MQLLAAMVLLLAATAASTAPVVAQSTSLVALAPVPTKVAKSRRYRTLSRNEENNSECLKCDLRVTWPNTISLSLIC
jgi:hypothetical protein